PMSPREVCVIDADVAWARVTRFPFDPDLPGLADVVRAARGGLTVVRYHPGRRCTLRLVNSERTIFAKVYASNKGARVYREMVGLWRAASDGELQFAVAIPLAWDTPSRTLSQS